jgi:hypothetical protein
MEEAKKNKPALELHTTNAWRFRFAAPKFCSVSLRKTSPCVKRWAKYLVGLLQKRKIENRIKDRPPPRKNKRKRTLKNVLTRMHIASIDLWLIFGYL